MSIPILNHMDFQKSGEIRNVLLHVTGSGAVSGPGTGQIIYDSGNVKVYNGSAWVTLNDTDTNTWRTVSVDTSGNGSADETLTTSETLMLKKGSNITLSESAGVVTITGTADTNTFRTVTAGGNTLTQAEDLDFVAGSGITITESGGDVTITNSAAAGSSFGTIAVSGQSDVVADQANDTLTFVGAGGMTITQAAGTDTVTFTSADTNTQLTTEAVQDIVGAMFTGNTETRIAATYEDGDGTIDLVVTDMSADTNTWRTVTAGGNTLSTSETLAFTAGSNISISESAGAVTIAATDTNTWRGVTAGGNTLASNEALDFVAGTGITISESGGDVTITNSVTNTDVDVSVANLKIALAGGFGSNAVTIGDSDDVVTIGNDLIITGDLTVSGDTVTTNTATLSVEDPLIKLATGNTSADLVDIGMFGTYNNGSTQLYAGLFRDASDSGKWHLYDSSQTDPGTGTTVNTGATGHATATLKASIEGNLTGNVTGTILTASQTNITAVGTIATGVWNGTAIAGGYIANDAIDSQHYTDGSIDNAHLAADCVNGSKIADDSIDSEHYVDASIDTAHIADDQVTYAKIQNVSATNRILGRDSSGAGVIEEITPANVVTMLGVAAGATANTAASAAEVKTGTNTTKFVTPDTLAAKSVVSLIDVSSMDASTKIAIINHALGTKDLLVQAAYKDAAADYQGVMIDWECTSDGSTDSDDYIFVTFAAVPSYDVVVRITSCKGATTVTPTYS